MLSHLRWALAAIVMGLVSPAAAAQDGEIFQDWRVRCSQQEENVAVGGCFIFQSVVNNQTQKPVMQIVIGYLATDKSPAAVVTLPLGVRVAPGILLQVDQNEALKLPFERCLPDGCRVQFKLEDNQLASLKAGIGGRIAFQDGSGQNITLPFSLKGFTAALASIQ